MIAANLNQNCQANLLSRLAAYANQQQAGIATLIILNRKHFSVY